MQSKKHIIPASPSHDDKSDQSDEKHIYKKFMRIHQAPLKKNTNILQDAHRVFNVMRLFMKIHKSQIMMASMGLFCLSVCAQLIHNFLFVEMSYFHIIIDIIMVICGLLFGMNILRYSILSQNDHETVGFLSGIHIPIVLSSVIAFTTLTILFIVSNTFFSDAQQPIWLLDNIALFTSAFVCATIISRFGFLMPAYILKHDEIMHDIFSKSVPFSRLTFLSVFLAKIVSLTVISIMMNLLIPEVSILVNAIIFTIYHILIFSLVGVSFKIHFNKIISC